MPVSDLARTELPASTAAWINTILLVFAGLLILWIVLKVIGFALRRSYNLTPVATAGSKDVRPDFLKVDRGAQAQMIERGRAFDRMRTPGVTRAASMASVGVIASGLISLVSAAFLAFGRVEDLDATWQRLSTRERFLAIVQSHPVGFTIALAIVVAAMARFVMTLRRPKQQGT
jgi:hypothetical protein